jgi:hypothetical protein
LRRYVGGFGAFAATVSITHTRTASEPPVTKEDAFNHATAAMGPPEVSATNESRRASISK